MDYMGKDMQGFYEHLDELFRQNKSVREIEDYLENSMDEAERTANSAMVIVIANELGGLCKAKGDFDRAKRLHKRVLEVLDEAGQNDTENYAVALINYADVYMCTNEMSSALPLLLGAEKLLIKCGLKDDYRMAALSNNISKAYLSLQKPEKAEEVLCTAFRIIESLPEKWDELATTYANLGEVKAAQQKYEEAIDCFRKSKDLFEQHNIKRNHYAAAIAGMAKVYYLQDKDEDAAELYELAIGIIKGLYGENPIYQMLKNNLQLVKERMEQQVK